ncbi:SDR family NAD(P)-dependent oxidoreductase [Alteromonas sp. a30]|uniref:SDR family NAD(P)-dependent oxidoreductase n=1 Tax=Alteromonas sp. a30 TaxID=2730917 RepID=UPI00227DF462|nr:SDR family NAD(P)-dependent oxidoreductase [Alteromonas sp. a30]MCY7295720.1 SDR family NAD(P)-dependent oxidoreductase [Alteromonas sp. a30]
MQTVLITGATSGIGEALALLYARQDWNVIACGRNQQKLTALTQMDSKISPLSFDVTQQGEVAGAAQQLTRDIDLLILNAGDCEYIDNPLEFDSSLFERIIKVNLISIGYCLEYFLKRIKKGGRLVLMSSSATYLPLPRAGAYGASKCAINYLANTLRIELCKFDIGVSLICPGFVKTPLTDKNEFAMPLRVEPDHAARIIYFDLESGEDEIHFPQAFTSIMKFLSLLPVRVWRKIASLMNR